MSDMEICRQLRIITSTPTWICRAISSGLGIGGERFTGI
jgi:hypothetical protein